MWNFFRGNMISENFRRLQGIIREHLKEFRSRQVRDIRVDLLVQWGSARSVE